MPDAPTNHRHRVLIVEDNPLNQKLIERILRKVGFETTLADNGEIGCALHAATPFDIILMDLQMPVMDGLTATRMIREREAQGLARKVPIIAVTANALTGDDQRCYSAGMDVYLTKPVNPQKLTRVLAEYTHGRSATS